MGHEVAVVSGHHYPHVNGSDFLTNNVAGNIQYTFPWDEGQIPNSWLTTPEVGEVSSSEVEKSLLHIVSRAHSREHSKLSIDTSTTTSFSDLEYFDPTQYYGSTDMSTTPSVTTPSIEEKELTTLSFWVMYLLPQSLFNQPNYLVELSDKEVSVMKFRTCQNMLCSIL